MNKRIYLLTLVVATAFLLSTPASAGVLYDNGPINGGILGWTINFGFAVADSFTLTGTSTLTGVANVGLWLSPGDSPVSLDWGISAAPDYTQSLGGGTVDPTITVWCSGCGSEYYDIYSASFSLPNLVLGPGTYYLSLQNGVTSTEGNPLYWDDNNGLSVAYENTIGPLADFDGFPGSNSSSFQILGDTSGVPEPASTAMFLSGLALVAGLARRKMRA